MVEVVVPLGALAFVALLFVQFFRLISHATLNRTIRKALDADPASARLLIEKLEPPRSASGGLIGWIMVVAGVAAGAISVTGQVEERGEALQIAVLSLIVGVGFLLYGWWLGRSTPAIEQHDPA